MRPKKSLIVQRKMEVFQRMTENNKQAEGTDTKTNPNYDTAIFAGGCFWCMVEPFDTVDGVEKVVSGYTGGHVAIQHMSKSVQVRLAILKLLRLPLIQQKYRMINC